MRLRRWAQEGGGYHRIRRFRFLLGLRRWEGVDKVVDVHPFLVGIHWCSLTSWAFGVPADSAIIALVGGAIVVEARYRAEFYVFLPLLNSRGTVSSSRISDQGILWCFLPSSLSRK